jgi:hypothetical protein
MSPFFLAIFSLSLLLAPWSGAMAQSCSKRSPPQTVALLELYTSEGCSSCPPADRFVSDLRRAGLDASQVVPLSLHVDYWDYIGWKDMFARPAFTQRQRWLTQQASTHTIYTPEFFISGHELREWRGDLAATVKRINREPAQAQIDLTLGSRSAGSQPLVVKARAPQDGKLFVVLYENGLSSAVRAGENGGVLLKHDYVVRDWIGPMVVNAAGGTAPVPRALMLPAGASADKLGVAAFVQDEHGNVLQALSLPLCTD